MLSPTFLLLLRLRLMIGTCSTGKGNSISGKLFSREYQKAKKNLWSTLTSGNKLSAKWMRMKLNKKSKSIWNIKRPSKADSPSWLRKLISFSVTESTPSKRLMRLIAVNQARMSWTNSSPLMVQRPLPSMMEKRRMEYQLLNPPS